MFTTKHYYVMADFTGNDWEGFMLGIKQTCAVTKGKDVEKGDCISEAHTNV